MEQRFIKTLYYQASSVSHNCNPLLTGLFAVCFPFSGSEAALPAARNVLAGKKGTAQTGLGLAGSLL